MGEETAAPEVDPILHAQGNCIPLAWARALGDSSAVLAKLGENSTVNAEAADRKLRRYAHWRAISGQRLRPTLGLDVSEPGAYLVHASGRELPHCAALIVQPGRAPFATCTLYHGKAGRGCGT